MSITANYLILDASNPKTKHYLDYCLLLNKTLSRLLLIRTLGTNFSEIFCEITTFSLKRNSKFRCEMAAILSWHRSVNFRRIRTSNNYDIYIFTEWNVSCFHRFLFRFRYQPNNKRNTQRCVSVSEVFTIVAWHMKLFFTLMSNVVFIMAGIFWIIMCQIALENARFPEHG